MKNNLSVKKIDTGDFKSSQKIIKKCIFCFSIFYTKHKHQKYCSIKCRTNSHHIQSKEWKKINRLKINNYYLNKNRLNRIKAIKKMGGKCVRCGFSDYRALQIDHINGGGGKERNRAQIIISHIAKGIEPKGVYQLFCANCNVIKKIENREGTEKADYNDFLINKKNEN